MVVPGEGKDEHFMVVDLYLFVIYIQKPEENVLFQSTSGVFYQKIDEGNWPMTACLLLEKFDQGIISKEVMKNGLKALDKRYSFIFQKNKQMNINYDE